MDLGDLLDKEAVVACLRAKSKKQAIQELSAKAAELTGLSERDCKPLLSSSGHQGLSRF